MKKTLTKILAVLLSVCLLCTSPVFVALADGSDCPVEEVYLTLHRPMYENVDGYWDVDDYGDDFFNYYLYEYIQNAATINIVYEDGTSESITLDELKEQNDFNCSIGDYGNGQYSDPWYVGDEIEAYFDLYHKDSGRWIYYDFNVTIEEIPIESISAVATKSLVVNAMGEYCYEDSDQYYEYDIAYTEPTFTVKWKESGKADSVLTYSEIKNTLYTEPEFTSNQSYNNEWGVGTH
ncbi:MAG: hypothetical protein IJA13_03480, partial [Clostridia bacterium]|nr:hypothetical protein [Clostridia bacterium]